MNNEKYSRGKIYKIVCNKTGKCYIGSTCEQRLCCRINKHRECFKRYNKGTYHFVSSFEIFENDDYDIVLVENYACNSKDELHSRERFWIENTQNCVNRSKGISDKKYRAVLERANAQEQE